MKKLKEKLAMSVLKSQLSSGQEEEYDEAHPPSKERKKKKTKGKESSGTDGETDQAGQSDSEDDEPEAEEDRAAANHLHYGKKEAKFGLETFADTDKPRTWHVLLRVIEGRDLKTGALRIRAYLEGLQKCTRVCAQGSPCWKQNLVFMLKDITLQDLAAQNLDIKVTRAKRFSEQVKGVFCCPMAAIVHTPGKAIISKWVALSMPFDEEDEEGVHENCGFLKVRLFRLHQLADEITEEVANNKGKPLKFSIRVTFGDETADSTAEEMAENEEGLDAEDIVNFNQDLLIPMLWPTVISKIIFHLYMSKGRTRRCLGQASIPMRLIYEPGNKGFMPTYGPCFLNFFGQEKWKKFKLKKKGKKAVQEGGSK
ncbi:unnamed protein product [Haemonchus placei]|uniref:C2 domain-containing protein n=1 Tax=Haemonchus placei TaxID=6290 RepID=A0A0N4W8W2_HAEPC|nr:unnamed protein product [Haemonchus placei]